MFRLIFEVKVFFNSFEAPRRVGSRPIQPAAAWTGAEFGVALPHVIRNAALNLHLGDGHDGFIAPQAARERSQVLRGEGGGADDLAELLERVVRADQDGPERRLHGHDPPGAGQQDAAAPMFEKTPPGALRFDNRVKSQQTEPFAQPA